MSSERSQADQDLLGAFARLAERECDNGVWLEKMYSKSVGAPLVIICGIGEQALALEALIMKARVDTNTIITPGTF